MTTFIITAMYKGREVTKTAYTELQAFRTINLLSREGATNIGMREEEEKHCPDRYTT